MDYLFLSAITVVSFLVFAKSAQTANNTKEIFARAIIPIILYCITYGLRVGWAIDYEVYEKLYRGTSKVGIDQYEPFFKYTIIFLRYFFVSSSALFVLVAFVFISSIIYILHDKKPLLLYALPIIYLFSAYQAANLVRYFLAMSFVYIAIEYLLEKKYIQFGFVSLIGVLIHYSMVVLIPILIAILIYGGFKKKTVNILLYIFTAVVSISVIQNTFVVPLSNAIAFVDLGDNQLAKYANQEAIQNVVLGTQWDDKVERSYAHILFNHAYAIIYLFYGANVINTKEYNGKLSYYYQLGALGLILKNIAQNAEIISRISLFFVYPSLIVTAFLIIHRHFYIKNIIIYYLFFLSILYIGFGNIKGLYELYDVVYIWNER